MLSKHLASSKHKMGKAEIEKSANDVFGKPRTKLKQPYTEDDRIEED